MNTFPTSKLSDPLFPTFFLGGFECSSHINPAGVRLNVTKATKHDRFADQDYGRMRDFRLGAARDGICWHEIERTPGWYDWSSVLPLVRAAQKNGIQVIWDLCHYGWPDGLDIYSDAFRSRFARMAGAFTRLLVDEGVETPFLSPVNEISFFSWAAGEVGCIYPFKHDDGLMLKALLVSASIAAIEAIWEVAPGARIVHPDPVIHVHADPTRPEDVAMAQGYSGSKFEAWDMISGRLCPEWGGQPRYLDIVGVNYYPHNQWIFCGEPFSPALRVPRHHSMYRPFREILAEVWERYRRPTFIAETGSDSTDRVPWMRYVGREVHAAMATGVPIEGICLYPIVNFPWWDDGHHLHNALWDYVDNAGHRPLHMPLANELRRQQAIFANPGAPWPSQTPPLTPPRPARRRRF